MLAAEEIQEALNLSSGWFLDNLWLVGLIPAIGFALIMGFGPGTGHTLAEKSAARATMWPCSRGRWPRASRPRSEPDGARATEAGANLKFTGSNQNLCQL